MRNIVALILLLLTAAASFSAESPAELPKSEILRLGEQMYRNGILPSGQPMTASIRGDVEIDSSVFSCSSCHLRSGLGSFEGGVITPPTSGAKLYNPYRRSPTLGDLVDRSGRGIYAGTLLKRPPYNRKTLTDALRTGKDPVGQSFNDVMPRYNLSDTDVNILIRYLELLSSGASPGATAERFKFATIITDDVSAADRAAMAAPLQRFIDGMNQQAAMYRDFINFGYTPTADMKNAFHQASLNIWELKGPPNTWRTQLETFLAKEPVFALLGGISNQPWQPIHDFCEQQQLPCLFPITQLPDVTGSGWYTFYFNKGYYQEGEASARFLSWEETGGAVVQIVQDSPAAAALAAGFNSAWSQSGRAPVTTITVTAAQLHDRSKMIKIIKQHAPGTIMLWSDALQEDVLNAVVANLSAPARLFVSSSYLGKRTPALPEALRSNLYITWPYRLTPFVGTKQGFDAKVPILATFDKFGDRRITSQIETMLNQSALQGLRQLEGNLFRDYLMDVMSMQMDQIVLDYERLSFGPGQRMVSKGCYIIQLGPGEKPQLLPRSGWIIQ